MRTSTTATASTRRCGPKRTDFAKAWQKSVKPRARALSKTLGWWYRQHYKLTDSDPRYLAASGAVMEQDFWAEYYSRRPQDGVNAFESDDFEADVAKMLGEEDEWEDVTNEEHP